MVLLGAGRTFPAGADISEFAKGTYASPPDLNQVVRYMDSYARPLVACIHGTALGGGLETALGCHWRIGADSCKVGLPEVHLGILPGAGGTQRLPRLTGFSKAVEIIVSGRMVGSAEAAQLGILDKVLDFPKVFSLDTLENAGIEFALSAAVQDTPLADRVLSARSVPTADGDAALLFEQTLQQVTKSSKGYLAPINIGIFDFLSCNRIEVTPFILFQSRPCGLRRCPPPSRLGWRRSKPCSRSSCRDHRRKLCSTSSLQSEIARKYLTSLPTLLLLQ